MKKLFTLTLLALLLAAGVNAQNRKTWDFTKGFSATTIANLQSDEANWTYSESGSSKKWAESKARTAGEISCAVNGETWIVPETEGLVFAATSAKHLNVVYAESSSDDTHIWLNGAKAEDAVTIPKVPAGEKLTVTFSSHGGNADRGFTVSTSGVTDANGQTKFSSAGQSTVELYNNNAEAVDVKLTAHTGGIHFYKFIIGEGDAPVNVKTAYLYDGTNDGVLTFLQNNESYELTPINVTSETVTAENLQSYDVTIIGTSVPADNAAVDVIKEVMPWTPIINLNGSLYEVWGYGEATQDYPDILVKNTKHTLLKNIELEDAGDIKYLLIGDDKIFFLTLGDYFKDDEVPAVSEDGTLTAIHVHNSSHNSYIYLPIADKTLNKVAQQLLENAITMAADSKANITKAAAPAIAIEYKDLKTNVTITAPKLPKAQVFYTTDGSEPTTASTEYTGVFTLDKESTVKAVAIAEGYELSAVVEKLVDIRTQPKTPIISYEEQGAQTTITITPGEEYGDDDNVKIYYNFEESVTTDTLKSTVYVDSIPVVITMPQYVTAFAVKDGLVWSEVARQRVLVKEPRVVIDVAAHYSAPQWTADNNPEGKSVDNNKGMFTWGASAATMYIGEGTPDYDPETGEETTIYGDEDLRPYEVVNEPGENPEWVFKSRGTCLVWQNIGAQTTNFGDDSNYNPMYSTDVDPLFPVTKNDIQFYKFIANETPNASIETLKKYQAPLDIVVLANMAGGPLVAQVSVDGESWQTVGEIAKTGKTRMWNKSTISYDGTDEVFVRITEEVASAGPKVFDIYIANQGEKSKELLQQLQDEITGIKDVQLQKTQVTAGIYNLNGARQNGLQRGLNIVVEADGTVKKVVVK